MVHIIKPTKMSRCFTTGELTKKAFTFSIDNF